MKHVKAENYLCFLALLEMILDDVLGVHIYSQFDLANIFGITLPSEEKTTLKNIRYSNLEYEYGVHINENKLNTFFQNTGIPLKAYYIKVNPYTDETIDRYENSSERLGKYIIYTYSYGSLFREPENYNIGHVALLEDVISDRTLQIYDPGPRNCGTKCVDRFSMYDAMNDRRAGIYVIERIAYK